MTIMKFNEVITSLNKKKRKISLLMGNGFSMAYNENIFSYNSLYDFITARNDELLDKLFSAIKTKNFELIMQQIDTTLSILRSFEADKELQNKVGLANQRIKDGLISSIGELHPENVFDIPENKSEACAHFLTDFLSNGGDIFTTNYDLLLYWVLMRQHSNFSNISDGFGRQLENPEEVRQGEDQQWSDLIWGPNMETQRIHYLHGALHIFDDGVEIVKEQYDQDNYLIDKVRNRLYRGSYPIFVTAGNGDEKLEHIRHNRYLSHCFDKLSSINGSLVTFGFNFGPYDDHIIKAINKAAKYKSNDPKKLWSIYIGTYSDSDIEHIESIRNNFIPKVKIFDAKTANVWGDT
ncbi:DUF4917 family protein [Xenorhabdus cabanillasii]|uniref:DUF4917 domain-containing protein n=1 Tax=Xenorhabdus cabanillasii JM26 TaxID=1427517 RepID=W1J8S1_9GAMM|nr:DUF4917 family protein [Xenorhabdus cabanillasii]PHM76163.1 hypothetical protein Xcab_03297 [Xenorhabdus cabanillasii JM26]CDL86271.1 conserved exported hypothetical protein [Xenorhabdus cabanillasii JM26]